MDDVLKYIAKQVNVREDYFERLFALAKERIKQWYEKNEYNHAFQYMETLVCGTMIKFSELNLDGELFPHHVLVKLGFSENNPIYVSDEKIDQDTFINICDVAFEGFCDDVFIALGHDLTEFYQVVEIDGVKQPLMGVDQLVELNKVWESPNQERPIREMIAILRNMNLKNKK